jgi:hypothetical protein
MIHIGVAYRLSASIMSDNNGQGRIELDDLYMLVVERPDSPNGQFIERSPTESAHAGNAAWRTRMAQAGADFYSE